MTRPIAAPAADGPVRRLARDRRASVSKATLTDGSTRYVVTDGVVALEAHDLPDANRRAYVHNHVNGFGPEVDELRRNGDL